MFNEGLYDIDFSGGAAAPGIAGSGMAVLRGGRILGTDRRGTIFTGRYHYDSAMAVTRIDVSVHLGAYGWSDKAAPAAAEADVDAIQIVAALPASPVAETTVEVAGRPVTVRLTYVGRLPRCGRPMTATASNA